MEHSILHLFVEPAVVYAQNNISKIYDYFEQKGYDSNIQSIQTISYQYTKQSLALVLMVAYIRPKKMYKNKECHIDSKAKTIEERLYECGLQQNFYNQLHNEHNFLKLKKEVSQKMQEFHKHPHQYQDFIVEQVEGYLSSNITTTTVEWIKSIIFSLDAYVTFQITSRLLEILLYHHSFRVKREIILWLMKLFEQGNLETIVILNFTEYFRIISLKILESKGKFKNYSVFYPEIVGQDREKELFLR